MTTRARHFTGSTAHRAGLAAEDSIALRYQRHGMPIRDRRWRGQGGEIDLIAADGDTVVFIEVKKSKSFDRALESLGARQIARLRLAAEEYLGTLPLGALTDVRFDVALVDGVGQIRVLENALA